MLSTMISFLPERIVAAGQRWVGIFKAAGKNWLDSQAFIYAAALAFFTVFSIAPVVILIVALVGLVLGEAAARAELMGQLEAVLGAQAIAVVETAITNSRIEDSGLWPTLAGIGATVVGATTVFAQMQKSLNQIWGVAPRPSRNSIWLFVKARLLSLTIVLAIGFVLLVSLLLSVVVRAVMAHAEQWLPIPGWAMVCVEILLSLTVVTLLFAAIFRILPDVLLRWSEVLAGAFITALLFTVGRSLIAWYLANTAAGSAYGAAGSLVLLLLWVNYSSLILLFGASICRAHLQAKGRRIRPRNTAVRVHRELLEDEAQQDAV
ncbi:MAG: YihY family inner membrane protein [Gammaproteobacteria bacterium]|jgi:membrane protein|nr:YihY family inner membrane protein [Gammaproteobacteria bacterium]